MTTVVVTVVVFTTVTVAAAAVVVPVAGTSVAGVSSFLPQATRARTPRETPAMTAIEELFMATVDTSE